MTNKKLSPLEALESMRNIFTGSIIDFRNEFDIIEKALKRIPILEQKVEDLEYEKLGGFIDDHNRYWKALEIIKKKTNLTKTNDGKKALVFVILEIEEQYDLLKEVLL